MPSSKSSVWAIPDDYEATAGSGIILAHGAGDDMHSSFVSYHQAFVVLDLYGKFGASSRNADIGREPLSS